MQSNSTAGGLLLLLGELDGLRYWMGLLVSCTAVRRYTLSVMTQGEPKESRGPNRTPQWLGGPAEPLAESEGMLKRAIQREIDRRGLGIAGLMDVARTAGSDEAEADRQALRHWLAGERNVRSDRLERALWALGITEEDLTELLSRRFKPIWVIRLRSSPPFDERYVRASTRDEVLEIAEQELGIRSDRIYDVGPFSQRKRIRAFGEMFYSPRSGVFFVPDGASRPDEHG